jgi:type I restriction enzyme S subunit
MMEEWRIITLGDVLSKIKGGGTPSKGKPEYWDGNIPWCSVKDMQDGKFQISKTIDSISEIGLKNSSSNFIPAGTVITSTRMGLGRVFIPSIGMAINQDLKALYPNAQIDNSFLLWLIVANKSNLENLGTGSTVKGIRLEILKGLKINLPPLPTQRKIASILSAYDDLIENNLKRIQLLEEKARLTYEEWFVRMKFPGHEVVEWDEVSGLPVGWEKVKLEEVVHLQQGFALNKKSRHHISEVRTEYPLLKIGDLFKGIETLFVKDTIPKQFLVEKDEIIYSRTGQVGHAFMGRKGVIYNNCFRVSANERIERILLYYFLISAPIVETAKALATGSAQPDLNHGAFKSIEINLPSIETQKLFSVPMAKNLELIYNLQNQNQLLKEARDLLLPRLMTGMIDVEALELGELGKQKI